MAFQCFACSRVDLTATEIAWSDVLSACVYVCQHCIWWRCRRKPLLRRTGDVQPPHVRPNDEAKIILDTYLSCTWMHFQVTSTRPPRFVHHASTKFHRWLLRASTRMYNTCARCGGPQPYSLHSGETGNYLFACCKTCIKWLLHCPTLTLEEDNRYWCIFDYVRTRYGHDGFRELWIGTKDFLYWLCDGDDWFRRLLTQ